MTDNSWKVISESSLLELLKTHAIVPREPSDELCKYVNKQSCAYISDIKIKTMLKFIIKASEG